MLALVCGLLAKKISYHLESGWRNFYEDNNLKVGDVCTFNIIETWCGVSNNLGFHKVTVHI
jgi:hypothetical protein